MKYEVEQKFPVDDLAAVEARLTAMGAAISDSQLEVDLYYAHPARDFAASDEALRIRRVGGSSRITYKGPKVDTTTKTRLEIDLPLAVDEEGTANWESLLEALGFQPVAEVRKRRRKATIPWEDQRVEASLDEVQEVGTFVELEMAAGPDDVEPAKAHLASLAEALGLSGSQRRSYLELLLEARHR